MAGHEYNYDPPIQEIYERAEAVRWMMRTMRWGQDLVDMICIDENPGIEEVRRLVYRYGPEETERRLRAFL